MEKLRAQHRKFMAGKAGFSLVELIIVIAIMAALIAVLAPQYLKYVERSRLSADQTTVDEIVNAAKIYCSDPDVTLANPTVFTCTHSTDGKTLTIDDKLAETFGGATAQIKSSKGIALFKTQDLVIKYYGDSYSVKCNVNYAENAWSAITLS